MYDDNEDLQDRLEAEVGTMLDEYAHLVNSYRYAVELEDQYYLADTVAHKRHRNGDIELVMTDVWAGDRKRGMTGRFSKAAHIYTKGAVYIEELADREVHASEIGVEVVYDMGEMGGPKDGELAKLLEEHGDLEDDDNDE